MILTVEDVDNVLVIFEHKSLYWNRLYVVSMTELQLRVRVHSRIDRKVLVLDVDFGLHGSGFEINVAGKANHLAGEGSVERIHSHLQGVANLYIAHGILGDGHT